MYNHSIQITNSTTLSELQRVLGDNLNADNVSAEQELRLKQLAIAYNKPMSTPISDLVTLWNDGDVQTTKVVVDTSDAEQRLNKQFDTFKNDVDTSFTSAVSNITSDMSADMREYQRKHDRQAEEFMGEASRQISKLKQLAQSMRTIEVKTEAGKVDFTGELTHEIFEDVLTTMTCDNVYLVGGAGAGKTTLGYQVAKAFKLPFYSASAVKWEHQLMGQLTATGEYKPTDFYRAFKDGGVFLFDEMDASHPNALVSFNQALDIQVGMEAPFPCGMVRKHKDFKAIASANTVGHGASRQYIGRNKLDGATLDRFAEIDMRYDEKIERSIAQNDKWVTEVRTVRAIAEEKKMAYIISPRASIKGAMLLRSGMSIDKVRNMRLYKGMTDADANILRKECKARMKATQESK